MKLVVDNLTVTYGTREALNGVSFTLQAGQVLAVVGPNGAGKTTLIRALSGVVGQAGRAQIDGCDLTRLSPMERARRMAVVPQARNLPPDFNGLRNRDAWTHPAPELAGQALCGG